MKAKISDLYEEEALETVRSHSHRQEEKDVKLLSELINLVDSTSEEDWTMKHFFDHLLYFHTYLSNRKFSSEVKDRFESVWATSSDISSVEDRTNPKYQQSTPKQRVLQYLKDLRNGVEKSILDIKMEN